MKLTRECSLFVLILPELDAVEGLRVDVIVPVTYCVGVLNEFSPATYRNPHSFYSRPHC